MTHVFIKMIALLLGSILAILTGLVLSSIPNHFQKPRDLVFSKVISSSELFDSDQETDGSEDLQPLPSISTSPTSPILCACCAWPFDPFSHLTLLPVPVSYIDNQHFENVYMFVDLTFPNFYFYF